MLAYSGYCAIHLSAMRQFIYEVTLCLCYLQQGLFISVVHLLTWHHRCHNQGFYPHTNTHKIALVWRVQS